MRLPACGGDCPRQSNNGRRLRLQCGGGSAPRTCGCVRCERVVRAASVRCDALDAHLAFVRLLHSALRCRSRADSRDRTAAACGEVLLMRAAMGVLTLIRQTWGFLMTSSPWLDPRSIVMAPGWRANPLARSPPAILRDSEDVGASGDSRLSPYGRAVGGFPCEHVVALTLSFPRIAADPADSICSTTFARNGLRPAQAPSGGAARQQRRKHAEDVDSKFGVLLPNFGLR